MSINSNIKPSSKLSAISQAVCDVVIGDFVAITSSLIGIGIVLVETVNGTVSGPLSHSWSIWGFGL